MNNQNPNRVSGWEKLRLPIGIAVGSWVFSQFVLYNLGVGLIYQLAYCGGYAFVLIGGSRRFGFVFIYRVMVPLAFGLFMVWVYREAYSITIMANFLSASRSNFQYLNLLFNILATLYAICIAFLLWKGLADHDMLRQMLSDEASYIERLVGYLYYFDLKNPKKQQFAKQLLAHLYRYIDNIVVGDEIKVNSENSTILRETVILVSSIEIEDQNDEIALAETMKSLSDLSMARSKRISQMEIKMSPYLLMALGIMSLAVIYPFFTEAPNSLDFVREMCILVLGTLLSFLLVTLFDISRPFNGFWAIKTDSFAHVMALIEEQQSFFENGQGGSRNKSLALQRNEEVAI